MSAVSLLKSPLCRRRVWLRVSLRAYPDLPQQVYTYKHVYVAATEFLYYVYTLQGVYVAVHIPHFERLFFKIIGKAFRHFLRERGNEYSSAGIDNFSYFGLQIVYLPFRRSYLDHRIEKPGRTDNLFGVVVRYGQFVVGGVAEIYTV